MGVAQKHQEIEWNIWKLAKKHTETKRKQQQNVKGKRNKWYAEVQKLLKNEIHKKRKQQISHNSKNYQIADIYMYGAYIYSYVEINRSHQRED